jgi:hypothetical protein
MDPGNDSEAKESNKSTSKHDLRSSGSVELKGMSARVPRACRKACAAKVLPTTRAANPDMQNKYAESMVAGN